MTDHAIKLESEETLLTRFSSVLKDPHLEHHRNRAATNTSGAVKDTELDAFLDEDTDSVLVDYLLEKYRAEKK